MNRRNFLTKAGLGTGLFMLPETVLSLSQSASFSEVEGMTFGMVADIHHDLIPDSHQRLEVFIEKAIERKVDMIIQMGDFCMGETKNKDFLAIWNQFSGPKYHLLGNHDMDKNSKEEIMDFWGMEKPYYSFNFKGIHFVVLDANFLFQDGKFIDYKNANFYVDDNIRTYINDEQIEWLGADLETTTLPTFVFSHQSLWHYRWGVKNRLAVQQHLEKHKDKIICCLNGHNHIDYHHIQNGIDYLEINSMSYQWLGEKFTANRYSKEVHEQYKLLSRVAPYQDPLYAFATVDPSGTLTVEGVRSKWMSPSPTELGVSEQVLGNRYSSVISDYTIGF